VDLCSIAGVKALVASAYHVTEGPVACGASKVHVARDTPPLASENWYFPNIPNSGSPETGEGRVIVEIFNDQTQNNAHFWQKQLSFLETHPNTVRAAGRINGVAALWIDDFTLVTPFGAHQDLQVTVYPDLDGQQLPNAEGDAVKVVRLVESSAFR
jgi:hypothetical protein